MSKTNLTRRSFVKVSALAGAAAAVGASMAGCMQEAAPEEELAGTGEAGVSSTEGLTKMRTSCHGCIQMCPAIAYLKDGVVVRLEGEPEAPVSRGSLCIKGLNQLHTMYSPRRILHPLRRAGERGENKWEVISWDEAITEAATHIKDAIDQYGNYAFFASVGGGGSYSFMEAMTLPMAFGSPTVFEPGCAQCYLPRWALSKLFYGGDDQSIADNAVQEIFKVNDNKTEVVVIWGAQPSVSETAESGRGMAELRAAGVKTVVVDPNFSPDAVKADVWLPVRPGTDTKLLLSWFRYIFENKLYDEEFTKYWTNLPFLIDPDTKLPVKAQELFPDFKQTTPENTPAYVCFDAKTNSVQPFPFTAPENCAVDPVIFATATVNGKEAKTAGQIYKEEAEPWTLEAAGETCWLDPERIREAIELYANADFGGLSNGVFSDHQENSSTAPLGALAIDALLGHVESPCSAFQNHGAASRTADRPTQRLGVFSSTFERYGLGWTTGLTKAENDRLLDAIVADWDAKGRDGKEMQRYFFQSRCDTMGANEHKGIHQWQTCAPKELRQAITTGEPYRPRVMYEMSGNKYAVMGPSLEWKKAYDEQDFVIQQYPNMTSFTVQTVDLFLPTTEWLEYDSYEAPGTHFNRHYARCQVTHLGETVNPFVSPYQVAEAAVEKLGAENVFDPDAYKVPFFESLEAARAAWAEQMGKGSWQEMLDDIDHRFTEEPIDDYMAYYQYKEPVSDGLPRGFATMSRKVDVYSEAMLRLARTGFPYMYPFDQPACDDYDPICTFKEPTESPVEGQPGYDPEYPLVITTGRLPHFHHGTMRHAPFIREVMPAPELKINPETAAEYGIEHLDWVKITSRRGSSNARAYLTQGIAPGVLITERFWNPECFDETQETITPGIEECGYNIMSADEFQNPCFATNSYRAFTVKIEKTERPERIWIESEQFQPFMPTLSGEPVTEEVF